MIIGLIIILVVILTVPFLVKRVEQNLEAFLFFMGLAAAAVAGIISIDLFSHIFQNKMLYFITAAVLIAGLLFKFTVEKIRIGVDTLSKKINLPILMFLIIVILGFVSSIITAIIASLVLVEVAQALPIERKYRVKFVIIACFSIGLGAALTPIGEPLATIVVSVLGEDFTFLARTLGIYIVPGVIAMGLLGAIYVGARAKIIDKVQLEKEAVKYHCSLEPDTYPTIFIRSGKIFLFVVALELLGAGFKPLINTYIIHLDSRALYWINMISAVLDNATLAAAEISPIMSQSQITAILMGLLVSGGMLIPGNIPNIVSACNMNIGSRDWAKLGVPLGLIVMAIYFVILFVF